MGRLGEGLSILGVRLWICPPKVDGCLNKCFLPVLSLWLPFWPNGLENGYLETKTRCKRGLKRVLLGVILDPSDAQMSELFLDLENTQKAWKMAHFGTPMRLKG